MSLAGKVALITGASKGIGKATAQRLASEGANLVINYNSDAASAQALVEEIGQDRALAVQADASKLADIDRLVDAAVAKFGKIDILIPNAGILPMRDLEHTTEEDFDFTYNLMVKGPYFLTQVRSINGLLFLFAYFILEYFILFFLFYFYSIFMHF
jgi:3-oxoacyl-[acyl-carrier protein] reductase